MPVTAARRAFLAAEWRTETAIDLSVLTAHPLSPAFTVDTLFVVGADALVEAIRVLVLRSVQRDLYELVVEWNDTTDALDINDVVGISYNRFAMSLVGDDDNTFCRKFTILGVQPNAAAQELTLTLWGDASGYYNLLGDDGAYLLGDDGAYLIALATET